MLATLEAIFRVYSILVLPLLFGTGLVLQQFDLTGIFEHFTLNTNILGTPLLHGSKPVLQGFLGQLAGFNGILVIELDQGVVFRLFIGKDGIGVILPQIGIALGKAFYFIIPSLQLGLLPFGVELDGRTAFGITFLHRIDLQLLRLFRSIEGIFFLTLGRPGLLVRPGLFTAGGSFLGLALPFFLLTEFFFGFVRIERRQSCTLDSSFTGIFGSRLNFKISIGDTL